MRYAIKNKKKIVKAYQLGANSEMEKQLIKTGAIVLRKDGKYELFSQESVNGLGELANVGDYFKVDVVNGKYFPYPNEKKWFESNHTHIQGNDYEQNNKPLAIWEHGDPCCEEMRYLIKTGKIRINDSDYDHYYNAFLWGAPLSAAKDAVVLFYSVDRDASGAIKDVDFNFVARKEFMASYNYLSEANFF